jgi:transposase
MARCSFLLPSAPQTTDELAGDQDSRLAQVVELVFGGVSVEEAGEILTVSPATVMRDWKTAKVWLLRELRSGRCR